MARTRSFRYTDFLRCPYCGGILEYLNGEVRDRHSPTGYAWRRKPITVRTRNRQSQDDRQVTEVVNTGKGGYEGEVRTIYEHTCDVICDRCHLAFSSKDERIVRREAPDTELPGDFWLEG